MDFEDIEQFKEIFQKGTIMIACDDFDERMDVTVALVAIGYDDCGRMNREKETDNFEYPHVAYDCNRCICYTCAPLREDNYVTAADFLALVNGDKRENKMKEPTQDALQAFLMRG